jgi:tetratricopeptide (TPR) repeat protein
MEKAAAVESDHCALNRQTIHAIEQKGRIPHPHNLRWLAAALNVPVELVMTAARQQRLNRGRATTPDETPDGPHWPSEETSATLADMDRRTVLRLLSAAVGATALDPVPRLVHAVEQSRATDAIGVQVIKDAITNARRLDDSFGSTAAVRPALAQRHLVSRLLATSHPDQLERQLESAAAEISQLLGWLAFDMDNPGLARRYLEESLRLARQADDQALYAYALAYLSIVALYSGHHEEGLAFIETATARASGKASPLTRSWLATVEAEAHAHLGDEIRVGRALDEAEHELSRDLYDGDPTWMYHYDRAGLTSAAGSCYLLLGQPEPARAYMHETISLAPSTEVREQALYNAWLAAT